MHVIASGSKGNATIIYDEKTTILVDLGISKARLIEGLSEINKAIDDIDFAFFTHSHSDHILNYFLIDEDKRYALIDTIPLIKSNVLKCFNSYNFKSFEVIPVKTSHDGINPCGFIFKSGNESLAYITDTGTLSEKTLKTIGNCTYYYFEANHDVDMLLESKRPIYLKDRIYGRRGHLSNDDSGRFLGKVIGDNTKEIVLAHLSEECNSEELALDTVMNVLFDYGYDLSKLKIKCARQYESVDL